MEERSGHPENGLSTAPSNQSSIATELLLARHQKGDSRAMDRLFFRVRGMLRAAIRDHPSFPFLPSAYSTEDVIQDLWVTLFARGSLDRFKDQGPGSLRAFLHRCLDHTMIDLCRRASADKRGGDIPHQALDAESSTGAEATLPVAGGAGPSTAADWGDWQDHCLRLLSGQDREVWRLRFVEDLAFADIAGRLEISESAARSAYHRAIEKLHQSGILRME